MINYIKQLFKPKGKTISINCKDITFYQSKISYEDVLRISHPGHNPEWGCTITYHYGRNRGGGILTIGESVKIVEGMGFTALYTGNA